MFFTDALVKHHGICSFTRVAPKLCKMKGDLTVSTPLVSCTSVESKLITGKHNIDFRVLKSFSFHRCSSACGSLEKREA